MSDLATPLAEALAAAVDEAVERKLAELAPTLRPYLNAEEAARYMACGVNRVHRLVSTGKLPALRDGTRLKIHPDEIDAYLREAIR